MDYAEIKDYSSRRAPELTCYRKLGCEGDLLTTLLSAFLYNLVIHSKKSNHQDFNQCYLIAQQIFNKKIDPSEIFMSVLNNCVQTADTPIKALEWCLFYINYYTTENSGGLFFTLMNNLNLNTGHEGKFIYFSNNFKVCITCLYPNQTLEYVPDTPGRYINIKIVGNNNYFYIPFSKHMIEAEKKINSQYFDQYFNSEPYIKVIANKHLPQFPMPDIPNSPRNPERPNQDEELMKFFEGNLKHLDKSTRISIRFPISYLPIEANVKPEFEAEYASFVKISQQKNQIRAFAFQLSNHMKTFPDDSYIAKIQEKLGKRLTMCEMNLDDPDHLGDKSFLRIMSLCENLMSTAVKSVNVFEEILPNLKFQEDMEQEFQTIEALSIILGVTSVIIFKDKKFYNRVKFNGTLNNFNPTFHFYAEAKEGKMKQVYALITRRMHLIENFDYLRQESKPVQYFIKDQPCQVSYNAKESKSNINDELLEFYKCLNEIQNNIMKNYSECIKNQIPPVIYENFKEEIDHCKILKNRLENISGNKIRFDEFVVMKIGLNQLSSTCGICNISPRIGDKSFFNMNGVFFHFDCVQNYYDQWFMGQFFNEKLENYEIQFPDKKKNILVINFLKAENQVGQLNYFKLYNDQGILCCLCNSKVRALDEELLQIYGSGGIRILHCIPCMIKINTLKICQKCSNNSMSIIENPMLKFTCPQCLITTILPNFWYSTDIDQIKCKKCWSIFADTLRQTGEDFNRFVNFGNEMMILYPCTFCDNHGVVRYIGEKFHCPTNIMCITCFNENSDKCLECGVALVGNLDQVWV